MLALGLALTIGTGLFVASEFSLINLERSDLEARRDRGERGLSNTIKALKRTSTHLSGAQLGITLTTMLTGFLAEPALTSLLEPQLKGFGFSEDATHATAVVLGMLMATLFSVLVGELVPKNLALSIPLQTAKGVVVFQMVFTWTFGWLIVALNATGNAIVRSFGIEPKEELSSSRTAEELTSLVRRSASLGSLDAHTATLLTKTLALSQLVAADVMTPRPRMHSVDASATATDVIALCNKTGHSRFPVTDGSSDDVIGVVHVKQAASVPREKRADVPATALMVEPLRVRKEKLPAKHFAESIIYEAHVKGLTHLNPAIPAKWRGKIAALMHPAMIEYLVKLGITAIELMPVHSFIDDRFLVEKGLRNYWGYNSINFFTPDPRYLATGKRREFRAAVRALHEAGIEVLLDVVYNHTAEGNHLGPTFSFKGIDNASYYRLSPEEPRHYWDATGCGNTLNMPHPRVLQMVMDSLRYWVTEMGVDGFRFDLASALGREFPDYHSQSGFFRAVRQDPVLSRVKMIAEPWDISDGGYRVGGFPPGWSEWNGKFRDTMRAYWKGDEGMLPEFASRLAGSADLYRHQGRRPWSSINFITAHDGFTLADLVSYNEPHNEANQETSGHDDNKSWNGGAEGPTEDAAINALRAQQQRNFLATLLFSQGVPMLLAGDERGHSQQGNNNAYCQDSDISWIAWEEDEAKQLLLRFTQRVIALRRRYPGLRRAQFLGEEEAQWLTPTAEPMAEEDWDNGLSRALMLQWGEGEETMLLLTNAWVDEIAARLPAGAWTRLVDTARPDEGEVRIEGDYTLHARSLVLMVRA